MREEHMPEDSEKVLPESVAELKARLAEAEETLRAIREGEVDAVVVSGARGEQVYSLVGAESVYRLIVDTMKEAALTVASNGTILYANGRFGEFVKQPMEQVVGRDLHQFVATDDHATVEAVLTQGRDQPVRQRLVFTASDGSAIPAHISSNVLDVPDGPNICIVATDLTELENSTELIAKLRQQRAALLESEERLRQANAELARRFAEIQAANAEVRAARRAAINLMEDAVAARTKTEETNRELLREIAERKQAEEALKASEQRFKGLSEAMPQIVWTADATGARDYHNPRALEFAGASLSDLNHWKWTSIIHPDDREATLGTWRQAIATGHIYEIAHRLRRADGEFRWHLTRAVPLRNDRGAVIQWIGTATDIHDQKMAEQELERRVAERTAELARSTALLENVTSNAPVVLFATDAQGVFTVHTGKGILASGRKPGELLGKHYRDFLPDRAEAVEQIRRALAGESFTAVLEGPSGSTFETRYNPLQDADGNVNGMIAISVDITERKQAEAELRRVNRALRALSASNQAMVRARDELELLQETCRILVGEGGYRMAWVGFAEQDADKTVRPVAHAGVEEGYLETSRISWADTALGRGPTGTAIRTGRPSVCQNMLEDPRLSPWRKEASRRGYAASCALPLVLSGKSIGALTVYSGLPEAFDVAEAKLLADLVEDLTYGLQALRIRAERQRMEEQVKAERQRLFAVLETLPAMICLLTADYHVAFANRAFREMFGESLGRRCYEYCFGHTSPCDFCQTYNVLKTGHPCHWEATSPDGSVLDVYDFPFTDVDGTPMILEMDLDITQRKRAEEEVHRLAEELERRVQLRTAQLQASNKELESFSYSVSHDLRAPLRAMDGFSRILLEEYKPQLPTEAQKYLDFVRESAVHMGKLIDGLLALSRLGRKELKKRPVEVLDIVRQSMDDLRAEWEGRAVEFVVGALPSCVADPLLLRQVFVNLLSNALKFSQKQEKARIEVGAMRACEAPVAQSIVAVQAQATGPEGTPPLLAVPSQKGVPVPQALPHLLHPDAWVYYVRDNGVGFDMRYADKLFGVFQRLHRDKDFEGTGVGLATVQQIIHKHGGQVWAEGKVHKGATFYFTLEASVSC